MLLVETQTLNQQMAGGIEQLNKKMTSLNNEIERMDEQKQVPI